MKKYIFSITILSLAGIAIIFARPGSSILPPEVGTAIDSLDNVKVYYNGSIGHVKGRNVTKDGYNLGLQWQCVEFVKRYYYEALDHRMPNSYGHAKDFFNAKIKDGKLNKDRNLFQFSNPGKSKPKRGQILIFDGNQWNPYGHVVIISKVSDTEIEIIQQNGGKFANTRYTIPITEKDGLWTINDSSVLGRLGK